MGALTGAGFVVVVLIGGINFVAVRVSNDELQPFWGAGLRFGLAAVIFVVIALTLRLAWPRGRALAMAALYGVLSFTLSYALMYWALTRVTAGMAAVLLAMVPLVTQFLASAHRMESLSRRNLVGATVALAGVTIMTVGPDGLTVPLTGLLAIGLAALTVGEGVIVGKKVSLGHPVMTNAVGMPVGALGLLAFSAAAGDEWVLPSRGDVALAVLYLVLIGSIGLFVLFLLVVRRWTSSATSYAFVLFPVVALLVEALLLGEPLTVRTLTGTAMVMTGVWFGVFTGQGKDVPRREVPDMPEEVPAP